MLEFASSLKKKFSKYFKTFHCHQWKQSAPEKVLTQNIFTYYANIFGCSIIDNKPQM